MQFKSRILKASLILGSSKINLLLVSSVVGSNGTILEAGTILIRLYRIWCDSSTSGGHRLYGTFAQHSIAPTVCLLFHATSQQAEAAGDIEPTESRQRLHLAYALSCVTRHVRGHFGVM